MGVLAARRWKSLYVCGLLPRATRQHEQARHREKAHFGVEAGTLHTNHKYVLYKLVLVNMNRIALAAQVAGRQEGAGAGAAGIGQQAAR